MMASEKSAKREIIAYLNETYAAFIGAGLDGLRRLEWNPMSERK